MGGAGEGEVNEARHNHWEWGAFVIKAGHHPQMRWRGLPNDDVLLEGEGGKADLQTCM